MRSLTLLCLPLCLLLAGCGSGGEEMYERITSLSLADDRPQAGALVAIDVEIDSHGVIYPGYKGAGPELVFSVNRGELVQPENMWRGQAKRQPRIVTSVHFPVYWQMPDEPGTATLRCESMSSDVSLDVEVQPREGSAGLIRSITLDPPSIDPAQPQPVSVLVEFEDAAGPAPLEEPLLSYQVYTGTLSDAAAVSDYLGHLDSSGDVLWNIAESESYENYAGSGGFMITVSWQGHSRSAIIYNQ